MMIHVKILSLRRQERYIVRRLVLAAQRQLLAQISNLGVDITEVGEPSEIGKYALVVVTPSLVIDERTVCSGRVPTKEEVVLWLREAIESVEDQE
jgi:Thioredoxin domain